MTDSEIIEKVAKIVRREVKQEFRLFLFGSRAEKTNDVRSDVDIGILAGNPISAKQLFTIREKIDEIPTLLKIDFLDFAAVDDEFQNVALKTAIEIGLREESLPLPTDASPLTTADFRLYTWNCLLLTENCQLVPSIQHLESHTLLLSTDD